MKTAPEIAGGSPNGQGNNKRGEFTEGLRCGVPIGLGYLSVSFSFGMLAVSKGIPILGSLMISMTNLTSAGQVAGLMVIAAGGSFLELILCQLVINLRYALMSVTVSQKLEEHFTLPEKLYLAFGITDEIFAVMAAREAPITRRFYSGLLLLPYLGWSLGTLLGSLFGSVLPESLSGILSIALYGMFLAIIVPPAKKSRSVLVVVLLAAALSCIFYFVPWFSFIGSGISVVICAVAASAVGAWLFPIAKNGES